MRLPGTILLCMLCTALTLPALGQEYGVGADLRVLPVDPASIDLDAQWANDAGFGGLQSINVTEYLWEGPTERDGLDIWSELFLGYAEDTLYVFMYVSRWDGNDYNFPEDDPWDGDHLLIGLDPTMEGDDAEDDTWGGWPANAPDGGPYVYKISPTQGVTLNWGDGPDPVEEGWVRGVSEAFVDEYEEDGVVTEYRYFSTRLAIYAPGIEAGSQIGFNIGGAFSSGDDLNWFAWRPTQEDYDEGRYPREPVAGHLQRYGDSYGTLTFVAPFVRDFYGNDHEVLVPRVDAGTVTIDGEREAAWDDALVVTIDEFAWDGGWNTAGGTEDGYAPEPDVFISAELLYTEGALLVNVTYEDYQEFYWNRDGGDMLMIGVDMLRQMGVSDAMMDDGWSGFPYHRYEDGPVVYFINGPEGVTKGWGDGDDPIDPAGENMVEAVVWVDDDTFTWGVEMALFSDRVATGNQLGFNVGGVAGHPDERYTVEGTARDYAWFSWQVCDPEQVPSGVYCGPGGTMLNNAYNYATLNLGETTSIEVTPRDGVPSTYKLSQNYPNPFNPSTTIEFGVPRSAHVTVNVFNAIGQKVATLIDGARQAGTYEVQWDAASLPSGMYLYQLSADGNVVQTRKMMLLK